MINPSTIKFSLLIANYNNGKFFKDCYKSIINQSYTNWEAVIVDDGSTDNSVATIKQLIEGDERFTLYLNGKNFGCGFTKRKCVALATGEVCGFIDPDDALTPDAVTEHYLCYQQHSGSVLIHSTYFLCDEQLTDTGFVPHRKAVDTSDKYYFNWKDQVTHFTTFIKEAYNKTEGIDAWMRRAEDQDLYLKMAETGSFYFLDKPLYLYRKHKGGMSHEVNGDKTFFWKWYAITQAAKRRNLNIEDLFTQHFVSRSRYDKLKKYYEGSWRVKVQQRVRLLKQFFKQPS